MYSPIYHSYVLYEIGCISCKILAYFSLFPVLLIAHLVFSFIHLKDASILLIIIGHLVNEIANSILKKLLKIPRPLHPGYDEDYNSGYGMPSAHAGFMSFYSIVWGGYKSIPVTMIVIYSRYHLQYHHADQLLIGILVGTIMGILWNFVLKQAYLYRLPYTFSKERIFDIGKFWRLHNSELNNKSS